MYLFNGFCMLAASITLGFLASSVFRKKVKMGGYQAPTSTGMHARSLGSFVHFFCTTLTIMIRDNFIPQLDLTHLNRCTKNKQLLQLQHEYGFGKN